MILIIYSCIVQFCSDVTKGEIFRVRHKGRRLDGGAFVMYSKFQLNIFNSSIRETHYHARCMKGALLVTARNIVYIMLHAIRSRILHLGM